MVCYRYEDCGPPLRCLPRSAYKRNGLQDRQYFQQGSIRYLCRNGPCPCPCPPMRYPVADASKGKEKEEGGSEKKENKLKRVKSRELRGGILYYSCHCIKRNGLQHDCRLTDCGGEPACLAHPDPMCAPSQLARARGLADPAPLVPHWRAQAGGGAGTPGKTAKAGGGGGKRFIVCELKGILPDMEAAASSKVGKCCTCSSDEAAGVPASGLPVLLMKLC